MKALFFTVLLISSTVFASAKPDVVLVLDKKTKECIVETHESTEVLTLNCDGQELVNKVMTIEVAPTVPDDKQRFVRAVLYRVAYENELLKNGFSPVNCATYDRSTAVTCWYGK